ncbi:MAG: hypothetical protein ACT4QE_16255 [Anaerolineales bacterium]
MLTGKGWFIWQISRCEGGHPQVIATRAKAAGCTHVLIKIAERIHAFGFDQFKRDLVPPVAEALRAQGIGVWGWHYVYGDQPLKEAEIAVKRTRELQLDGYVIDAEIEYKHPAKVAAARQYMSALRKGLPDTPIALSSFRYPSLHAQLPWQVFLDQCDYAMPQVYWERAHNPAQQLERSVTEFNDPKLVGAVRPIIPTGAAYGAGNWRATPGDVEVFLQKALELKLPAANLYSWDYATQPAHRELWDAATRLPWPEPQSEDILTRWLAALNAGSIEQLLALYQSDAAHVTAQHILQGHAALQAWYVELLQTRLPRATFILAETKAIDNFRHARWSATTPAGAVVTGKDSLGLLSGRIQYHFTTFEP